MLKYRLIAVLFIVAALFIGYFDVLHIYSPESYFAIPFNLGLDLQGGAHLVYKADTSAIATSDISNAMEGLRDVIEKRVNIFGVGEPLVQIQETGTFKSAEYREHRLIVELPGITNTEQAIKMIGETPFLEFRVETENFEEKRKEPEANLLDIYLPTDLTGRFLKKAKLDFGDTLSDPMILLEFDDTGAELFAQITKDNVDKTVAIFLDPYTMPQLLSSPKVNEEISGGRAQIVGNFTINEAKMIVQRLNSGALSVPINLISQQNVGATLGEKVLNKGIIAGIYGLILVAIFMLLWYRLPGLIAILALSIYIVIVLAIFKLIPVTLTASGIAGFILSLGIAVDANVLIFERMKEELAKGKSVLAAIMEGFDRAWLSIRDSNISSLISAFILFWLGSNVVKGFALTLSIGILVSMFTAITVSRTFLLSFGKKDGKFIRFLFGAKS